MPGAKLIRLARVMRETLLSRLLPCGLLALLPAVSLLLFSLSSGAVADGEPGLHYADNVLVYCDASGRQASALGVDTSFYNGDVDWEELKKTGIDFALIRLGGRGWGTGSLYTDVWFLNSLTGAADAGLNIGIYFYSMAATRTEAVGEARYVLDRLNGAVLQLPVYFDMEFSGDYPSGRTDGLTTAQRVDFAFAFCETIERAGYSAGIYANESFLHDELNLEALSDYPVWVASYTENNAQPGYSGYAIWQFTDSVRLPGINGLCDLNAVFDPLTGIE